MYRIGFSSNGRFSGYKDKYPEELFAHASESGIQVMEIEQSAVGYADLDMNKIFTFASKHNIELWSMHLPIANQYYYDISNKYALKCGALEYQISLIKRAANLMGIKHFVIHSGGEPLCDGERAERVKLAGENLSKLADIAESFGAVIAIEDLPRTCLGRDSDEILEILKYDSRLRVCFDANHLFREPEAEFIRKIGKKIVTTHISDRDNINERHWLPGEGIVDWQAVLQALKDVGYEGVWVYEIGFGCPRTIYRDRELNCADFVRNAREIFEGKAPTVFSTPKQNLGMWE